jgi:hypothetical protein
MAGRDAMSVMSLSTSRLANAASELILSLLRFRFLAAGFLFFSDLIISLLCEAYTRAKFCFSAFFFSSLFELNAD